MNVILYLSYNRDTIIQQLQQQISDLSLYLEEERVNHRQTKQKVHFVQCLIRATDRTIKEVLWCIIDLQQKTDLSKGPFGFFNGIKNKHINQKIFFLLSDMNCRQLHHRTLVIFNVRSQTNEVEGEFVLLYNLNHRQTNQLLRSYCLVL